MECGEAREQLYRQGAGYTGSGLVSSELRAKGHVDQCDACQEFFASEDRIKGVVRDHIAVEPAPAELRERILGRIAEQRRGSRRTKKWLVLVAGFIATLVLGATVLWIGLEHNAASAVSDFLVEDHVHNLAGPMDIASTDAARIESWLRQRVDFSFHLPLLGEPRIAGGRICQVRGRQAALIHYEFKQYKASLFILNGRGLDLPEKQLIPLDGKRCLVESGKGYNVVAWKERGLLYGLVSDANSAELLRLAASF